MNGEYYMPKRIFVALSDYNENAVALLKATGSDVVLNPSKQRPTEEELKAIARDFDVLIIGAKERMTTQIYDCVDRLRILGTLSVGVDHIDGKFFNDRRFTVVNAPRANTISVAEHTLGLMLCLAKRMLQGHQASCSHKGRSGLSALPIELSGKTIGVIGAGSIGTEVMKLASFLGMRILCFTFNPEKHRELGQFAVEFVELPELVRSSNIVTVHLPLTPQSKGIVSSELIRNCVKNSIFVNTARPEIVDNRALVNGLQNGTIFGVGIDTDDSEIADLFKDLNNAIITPHVAGLTEEAIIRMDIQVAETVAKVIREGQR